MSLPDSAPQQASMPEDSLLRCEGISVRFGGLTAVDNFNFNIGNNELVGLIGPNGAGKTTVFNLLTGVYQPTTGQISFNGHNINGSSPHQICNIGIARTFQNIRLFKNLTVLENVLIASNRWARYNMLDSIFRTRKFFVAEKEVRQRALSLLEIFSLQDKAEQLATSLPYGEQRKLEILRALATSPQLILLDEPAAGMNHSEKAVLMQTIAQIRSDFKLAVLLIEHDMKLVMGICGRIVVLDHGQVIAEGRPSEIQSNPRVIEAYLGPSEDRE